MQYIVEPLANLMKWSFGILEWGGNLPIVLFIILGFVMMIYWIMLQKKYNAIAENDSNQIK